MKTSLSFRLKSKNEKTRRAVLGLLIICMLLSAGGISTPAQAGSIPETDPGPKQSLQQSLQPLLTPSIFGVDFYLMKDEGGLGKMAEANAYWARRNGVAWSEIQPTKDSPYDWAKLTALDEEIGNAVNMGMQVVLTVRSAPSWAQKINGKACGPIKEEELISFTLFMKELVTLYKDRVKYWELWNEPDIAPELVSDDSEFGCWGDASDDYYGGGYYAEMLKAVYPNIKDADPQAQVLVGGLLLDCDTDRVCPDNKSSKFLEGILRNGGGDYFDGVSMHAYDYYGGALGTYANQNWSSAWNSTGPVSISKIAFIKDVLQQYHITGKYLMNTETALVCDTGCDNTFETTKANYLVESYAAAMAGNLKANIWYSAQANWRNSALMDFELNLSPAYNAYKVAHAQLADAIFVKEINAYSGVFGYEFRKSDRRIWLVWSRDGAAHSIDLPGTPLELFDLNGFPKAVDEQGYLPVTLEPAYIHLPPDYLVNIPVLYHDYHLLRNSDFEAGSDIQGNPVVWNRTSYSGEGLLPLSLVDKPATFPQVDANIPSGKYSLLLGSPSFGCNQVPVGVAGVNQTFAVPNALEGKTVRLNFKYIIYSQDASTAAKFDRFEVRINDRLAFWDGNLNNTNLNLCLYRRVPEAGWATASIDLVNPVDYRGKTINLSFENWSRTDNFYNTFTYLDDIQIEVVD